MDGSTKAILILFLLIGVGIAIWYLFKKTEGSVCTPTSVEKSTAGGDGVFDFVYNDSGDCVANTCVSGYTFGGGICTKSGGTPTVGPDGTPTVVPDGTPTVVPDGTPTVVPDGTPTVGPCNPKNSIKYGVYEYEPSGKCAFSGCMSPYKYNKKTNACVPASNDPLYLDCMANTKGFVKVSGSPRPSDPNKARLWDAAHSSYCNHLSAQSSDPSTDTITGKYQNGKCYISINQKCKTYPQMDNIGRFDDSTAGGPKDTSESMCKFRVKSWKKDCN